MSKAVLISIRPKWCELIASGKKTIEVRKTSPKIEKPFKCYIYCTKEGRGIGEIPYRHFYQAPNGPRHFIGGTVIGEFICDRIYVIVPDENGWGEEYGCSEHDCLSDSEMLEYLGDGPHGGFGWHISNMVIYDEPKKLSDFRLYNTSAVIEHGLPMPTHEIRRPPQSWCYVEELP